jgi:hypothetical protein
MGIMGNRNQLATLLLVASASLLGGCSSQPESVVEKFYRALEAGETTKARTYVSGQLVSLLGEDKTLSALSDQTGKISACGGIKSIETDLQGEGEVRTGTVVVTFNGDCPPKHEKTKLIKEDGNWKVSADK